MENFAARVFQHEFDHLQGIVNVHKKGVETKSFPTQKEMEMFLAPLKVKIDTTRYIVPLEIDRL
ncbi:MAG: hypothetical protein BGO77_01965 [Caedibacter sp. 37-49]|nr:MAG: hypothetical protein BGO77_01965 [Caedibacter sp. 37-49]